MTGFLTSFWSDPLWYIGALLAFAAALAFLTFLRGFLSGFPHFFTLSSHDEHQHHHRVRVMWGFMLLVVIYLAWRLLSWFGSLF